MTSLLRGQKNKRRRRRSEMRLGKTYEQVTAREELPVLPVGRPKVRLGSKGASLLLAITLVSLVAYLFVSDSFYVYEAEISGNRLVSTEEICLSSGVEGYSVFFIDPQQVAKAVSSLPDVRDARVRVSLPNHLSVEVHERRARVTWQTGDERYGVDDEGTILPLRDETETVIVIRDLDSAPRQPGEQVGLEIMAAIQKYGVLLPHITEFDYSQQYGLSLENEFGWRIYLGNAEDAEAKVTIMETLAQRLASQGEQVEYIDVRFPESPLYRLAGG